MITWPQMNIDNIAIKQRKSIQEKYKNIPYTVIKLNDIKKLKQKKKTNKCE